MYNRFIDMGEIGETYLSHFGIKGQKWGVRRSLGPDGRITGSKYSTEKTRQRAKEWSDKNLDQTISGDSKKRKMSRAEYNVRQAEDMFDATGRIVKAHESRAERKAAKTYRDKAKTMSDEELRQSINRMQMEQNYSRLKAQDLDTGKATASDILASVGDTLAVAGSVATIASTVYMMKKIKE